MAHQSGLSGAGEETGRTMNYSAIPGTLLWSLCQNGPVFSFLVDRSRHGRATWW